MALGLSGQLVSGRPGELRVWSSPAIQGILYRVPLAPGALGVRTRVHGEDI